MIYPNRLPRSTCPLHSGCWPAAGSCRLSELEQYAVIGELALEGMTRPIKGVLSIAIEAAKNANLRGLVVPAENASEAAVVEGIEVIAVDSLAQAVAFFAGEVDLSSGTQPARRTVRSVQHLRRRFR